jgi:hypothetical protein
MDELDDFSLPAEIMTVKDLIKELTNMPMDAPIMIAVVKYPEEFAIRIKQGEASWTDSTDVDVLPLETGEVTLQRGCVTFAVELTDYSIERHMAGG